jgi:GNAT superfamily N-acetyltransferase
MAEAAVRAATEQDAPEIARIQRDTWLTAYSELLPATVLAELDLAEAVEVWRRTVTEDGPGRVFVATEGAWTVGFCVIGPAPADEVARPDGSLPADAQRTALVGTLLVEPRWGRRGHGGRLLVIAAAALREQGAERGVVWVPESDRASADFYLRAGWQPDGVVRTLDAAGHPLRELRLTGTLELKFTEPN